MRQNRQRSFILATGFVALMAALAAGCGSGHAAAPEPSGSMSLEERWQTVDRLVEEQKHQAAVEELGRLREAAAAAGLEDDWARALVREAQLTASLGEFEGAVRLVESAAWPEPTGTAGQVGAASRARALLRAQTFVLYLGRYGWEIGQRERSGERPDLDFTRWTSGQLAAEIDDAFLSLWVDRESWGLEPTSDLAGTLEPNDLPKRIRGTLRDSVTHLWAGFLANSAHWSASDSNQIHRLDLEALIAGRAATDDHPLARLAALYGDLERWHLEGGRGEAALDARMARLQALATHFTSAEERQALRADLEGALGRLGRDVEWWSTGRALLAEWTRDSGADDALARARDLAAEGAAVHPDSFGGRYCRHLVAALEAPSFSLQSMLVDGPERRSILVRHRNLDRLFFRAWWVDLEQALTEGLDRSLLPGRREVEDRLIGAKPDFEWEVDLPATPDLEMHQTYVVPPSSRPGLWLVAASADRSFSRRRNRVEAVHWIRSAIVLDSVSRAGLTVAEVRDGASGDPVEGAEVELWGLDYRRGHRRQTARETDHEGAARFVHKASRGAAAMLVARHGEELAFQQVSLRAEYSPRLRDTEQVLLFTDRSVYRPGQQVLWKAVAYRRVEAEERQTVLPGSQITVELVDANWEVVASTTVEANSFGSASGSFELPQGRLLGDWQLRATPNGSAPVKVEEYKRPTFEVTVEEPEAELRLNRTATFAGEARYYFGAPLVDGEIRWTVTREPRYPDWWGWWRPQPVGQRETVAGGVAALDADGAFTVTFLPEADERKAGEGLRFRYRLSVDATDAGGETRSAERTFTLGFTTVEATLTAERAFATVSGGAGGSMSYRILRTDLDGVARAGSARWRLVALDQPDDTRLPTDMPVAGQGDYRTEGDELRPRWDSGLQPGRMLSSWADGAEHSSGVVEHGEDGVAALALADLVAGAYRLHYATDDAFGSTFERSVEFVVAGDAALPLPLLLESERRTVPVGERARILVHSGFPGQWLALEIARPGRQPEVRYFEAGPNPETIELPVGTEDVGGLQFRLRSVRDYQPLSMTAHVAVPPRDEDLRLSFSTFRDRLRPGDEERWRIEVATADGESLGTAAAELLAYMFDRSLDLFAAHTPPRPAPFARTGARLDAWQSGLGSQHPVLRWEKGWSPLPDRPYYRDDRLKAFDDYGIGGPGRRLARAGGPPTPMAVEAPAAMMEVAAQSDGVEALGYLADGEAERGQIEEDGATDAGAPELRTDFSETAFWEPHLLTGEDGSVVFEFTVPDSVTEWSVWVHALTTELDYGRLERQVKTTKDLLVRPYLPRFLREGDRAELRVVVQNSGESALSGRLDFDLLDPETEESVAAAFDLDGPRRSDLPFALGPGEAETFSLPVAAPNGVGEVAVRAVGTAGDWSDGELRPLPLLPGRVHLIESRFAALDGTAERLLEFAALAEGGDATRVDEQFVVTLDGQLFQSVLSALPYLVDFPYECTEQTLNRFVSTGIVREVFEAHPLVAELGRRLSERDTRLEPWDRDDPNRSMALVETPWLGAAAGGAAGDERLIRLLDPEVARAERDAALARLTESQTAIGGFPWWPGGPPSPYMTLYILGGLSRALEFGVDVPRELVEPAWGYLKRHYFDRFIAELEEQERGHELMTMLNFVLSSYPDESWTGGVFTAADRERMLELSFRHWKNHSPLIKGQLALTLERAGRSGDARLVFDSVMDSAKESEDLGTYWAPEERAWLWYNDSIETHAFALRVLGELDGDDPRRRGLVHWLLLNKKLSHWKSTRATAEVLYSLIHYLSAEGELGVEERATVELAGERRSFDFLPDDPDTAKQQWVVAGEAVTPGHGRVTVTKDTPGLLFASATWHYSTETMPEEASSDFFGVERRYWRRTHDGTEWRLEPIEAGATLEPGDQVEVELSIRASHAAEYVHLRDPRAAGLEPEAVRSGYRWGTGVGWYEQVRDSGTDFFFEWLPVGEYTLRYRLRANLGGTFRVGPATLQSMYAPEFAAFSAGDEITVSPSE